MARSHIRALEQEVLAAARAWRSDSTGVSTHDLYGRAERLIDAVKALDEAAPGPIDGEPVSNGVSTSNRAANAAWPLQSSVRRRIISEIAVVMAMQPERRGCTSDELEHSIRRSHATVSAAVNHLVGAGWLIDSGFERPTRSGREAIVWRLSEPAIAMVQEEVGS